LSRSVDLAAYRSYFDLRVDEARGPDDLLDDRALRQFELELGRASPTR